MPTPVLVGNEVKDIDMLELLPADEGEINQIYGRIGAGKTYCAVREIVADLKRGQVWYVNWKIDWNGYSQYDNKWYLLLGLLGLKRYFYVFPKENLHFFEVKDTFVDDIARLTDCKIALDEGHILFDSYEMAKMKLEKRNAVLWTRHFDRTYLIISQRPSAVHVTMRANVNRFYKCEKLLDWKIFKWRFIKFLKTEFQDTKDNDTPDETRVKDEEGKDTDEYAYAVSSVSYWGRKKFFKVFDTKYRREGMPSS